MSIEELRIQSLVFILIGFVLSFLLIRKIFGAAIAFFAIILVASQSTLLLSQAQEARHYAMFFACGAWVLYMQNLDINAKNNKWLTFLAHFFLCQIHYLGIIFSLMSGTAYFLTSNNISWWKRIPMPVTLSTAFSIVTYIFYFTNQRSVLNTWPKPNELSDLLASYNDSLLILTILIPIFTFISKNKSNRDTKTRSIEEIYCLRPIIITSLLWFSIPLIFWTLSHLTSLNLFADRYFIPKEAAIIFLVAYCFYFILQKLAPQNLKNIPLLSTLVLSVILILISTKRAAFGFNKDTNYHHSLIIEKSYPRSEQPIILQGDPKYFPNAYLGKNEYLFTMENKSLIEVYRKFSSKIKFHKK